MIEAFPQMALPDGSKNTCVTFTNGNKQVSLALDNSCGRLKRLSRGDIRLHMINPGTQDITCDVTSKIFTRWDEVVPASIENFKLAMSWLDRCSWEPEGI